MTTNGAGGACATRRTGRCPHRHRPMPTTGFPRPSPPRYTTPSRRHPRRAGLIRSRAAHAARPAPRPLGGLPPSEEREAERGLRGLVGSGASQVDITAAMRARDASRPSAAEEAEAMNRLVVVRRNWVPREDLPRGGGRPTR